MTKAGQILKRVFLVLYLLAVHALAVFFLFEHFVAPYIRTDDSFGAKVKSPNEETPVPTIMPVPSIEPENTNTTENAVNPAVNPNQNLNSNSVQTPDPNVPPTVSETLMIPVAGIKQSQLLDTFTDSRSENRVHDAIDIPAPAGTPVVAAANGEIAKFFDSNLGGITIYQYSTDKKYVYYYAHLQSRAPNLAEKAYVKQGTVIGYVGDTGNAGPGNSHLHFSIALLKDPKRYWDGEYINPYLLLKNAREAR
jgi:murein DD-endopeptidase MepM/ murein hydrolase activator NlpD